MRRWVAGAILMTDAIRTAGLILLAGTWLAGAAAAQTSAPVWKKYSYPIDGFEVEFSGDITASPTSLSEEKAKLVERTIQYLQDGGSYAYLVTTSINKHGVNFGDGVTATVSALKCKDISSDKPLELPGGTAREIRAANCEGGTNADVRFYTIDKRFYQILALYPSNGGDVAAARHFVESFKLIPMR